MTIRSMRTELERLTRALPPRPASGDVVDRAVIVGVVAQWASDALPYGTIPPEVTGATRAHLEGLLRRVEEDIEREHDNPCVEE